MSLLNKCIRNRPFVYIGNTDPLPHSSFLMSTILRIGSLMKVGFGEAGAKIIKQSLTLSSSSDIEFVRTNMKKKESDTNVSCIFLFCDIRRFTDATECLREEVFVFTNKIAAVVHSFCHSYGGSANKNIGDAFLVSWLLTEDKSRHKVTRMALHAADNQADKALLSVVRIIISLQNESFFLDELREETRSRLTEKFAMAPGTSLVQMGFGLHAGKAVQGAIGSQRKLDATYISNAVEQAEYLESSTKRYGVKMLMSGEFYTLLHKSNQRRCRQLDQVFFRDEDGDEYEEPPSPDDFEKMELYTFDMDDSTFTSSKLDRSSSLSSGSASALERTSVSERGSRAGSEYRSTLSASLGLSNSVHNVVHSINATNHSHRDSKGRRWSMNIWNLNNVRSVERNIRERTIVEEDGEPTEAVYEKLILPTELCIYDPKIWLGEDMRQIRGRYTDGVFFQKFNTGLQMYFNGDWENARDCFQMIDSRINDGPSRYFLKKMQDTNYYPPRGFTGWSEA